MFESDLKKRIPVTVIKLQLSWAKSNFADTKLIFIGL